ncbi:MAG: hypothetical protein F4092_08155, partial [Rhodospirillaceae bacterium]|nr:hypothetical protein [Rhodospirillaceae bacterium]
MLLRMVEPPDADPATEDSPPDEIGPFRQFNLSEIHSLWQLAIEAAQADDRPPPQHPIAPVVRTWQEHAPLDRRQTGIMPAAAGVQIEPGALVRPDPSHLPDFGELRHADPGGNLWLPGLDIDAGGAAAFILAILDAGSTAQPGAGAPLRDRFFAEMLMAASTKARATRTRWFLDDLRIADPVEWADWNPAHYRPEAEKRGLALSRALVAVNSIQLPLNDRGGWLIPVFVEAIKSRALDDPIIASVRLPEGSNRGARVDRPTLRRAGKASAVAWRLYLALCFEWNRIAVKGRIPHLTRPQMKRNIAGYLVDARDKILTDSRGQPMRSGKHARAVETGGREPSPAGERLHRVYAGPA